MPAGTKPMVGNKDLLLQLAGKLSVSLLLIGHIFRFLLLGVQFFIGRY
jgi:hypothetical protein